MAGTKDFWQPAPGHVAGTGPPLDEATLARCEAKYRVRFPRSFVELYLCQNGGVLRDCQWPDHLMPLVEDDTAHFGVCIRPLSSYAARGEILDDDCLDWVEEEYGDPGLVFVLWTDGHVCCTLNFNKRGPTGEPSVVYFDFECISDNELADTFGDWLASLFRAEDAPSVDWSEARQYAMLAEETVEVRYLGSELTETVEQVLSAAGDQLLLFTRTRRSDGSEQLERATLPRGIDPGRAHISPFRPQPCPTFTLHLQPAELDDIEWVTSRRTSEGTWKNDQSRGVPVYCTLESADRSRLEALRSKLLGGKIPKALVAQEEMQGRWETMSASEQESALAQQMLAAVEQMDKRFKEQEPDLGPVPDELKVAAKRLEGLKTQMLKDLKRLAGASPGDAGPETDVTSQFAALIDEFTGIVAGVSHEQAAQDAIEKMDARADEYRSLFTRFTNQSGLADQVRFRATEQRLQEAVQRVRLHSPPAHAMIESFLNQLLLSALQPTDPESDEAKLLERWEAVSRQLVETLRTIHDEASAGDVRPQLEEQTQAYEACHRQFIDRIDEMETMQAGILMQGRAASRSALYQELHRIRHQVPGAYKRLGDVAKRLRETGL